MLQALVGLTINIKSLNMKTTRNKERMIIQISIISLTDSKRGKWLLLFLDVMVNSVFK